VATPVTGGAAPKVHRRRFLLLYIALGVLLSIGAAIGVHMATRTVVTPPPWSAWVPPSTTPEIAVREIAAHVQGTYTGPDGKELVTVRGGPLSVGSDPAVLVKPDSTATGGYKFFDGASVEYQLCGNTTKGNCTIDQKKIAPNTSGALTRRMAYELALTTFHYVPEVQNVAVLLPAVIKGQKARMLVLSRGETKDPRSLTAAIVPIKEKNGQPNPQEALKIANATDPLIFHYEVTATSDNQPVYLITPLLIKDTAAAPGGAIGGSKSSGSTG
jgi:hypothetical protein